MKNILFKITLLISTINNLVAYDFVECSVSYEKEQKTELDYINRAYYIGFIDGLNGFNGDLYCTTDNVKMGQLYAIVRKYIKNNPEKWNEGKYLLVLKPLREAFPCKK